MKAWGQCQGTHHEQAGAIATFEGHVYLALRAVPRLRDHRNDLPEGYSAQRPPDCNAGAHNNRASEYPPFMASHKAQRHVDPAVLFRSQPRLSFDFEDF